MLRIGHFSRITGVAIKTLRYYDQIGLLKPDTVDPFTGYRYYSLEQWRRLNRILALKELGLSLEQIIQVLEDELLPAELQGMLKMARFRLENERLAIESRIIRIDRQLQKFEMENQVTDYEIVAKAIAPIRVLSTRHSSNETFEPLFNDTREKVRAYAERYKVHASGPMMGVFHEDPFDSDGACDFEVAFPTESNVPVNGEISIRTLPAVEKMATLVYDGPTDRDKTDLVYETLLQWIEEHNYVVGGPYREIFHQSTSADGQSESVIEIQFPIKSQAGG